MNANAVQPTVALLPWERGVAKRDRTRLHALIEAGAIRPHASQWAVEYVNHRGDEPAIDLWTQPTAAGVLTVYDQLAAGKVEGATLPGMPIVARPEADNRDMKIGAIAPWFGGKRTLAAEIVVELGPHTQYFEIFCGSMAVLLAKEPSQKETVNDLHGDLINLARVLQNERAAEQLYDRLIRTLFSEGLLDEAREVLDDASSLSLILHHLEPVAAPAVNRAYWYFLASWMGRNGTAGTERLDYQIAVRWTKGGGSPTVRFRNALDSIPEWHRRLRNVVILRRNAFDILDRFEDVPGTVIYADPPYASETCDKGAVQNGRGGRYLHEFAHEPAEGMFGGEDDHARLSRMLHAYQHARVVVSYYDCPRIRQLYAGWTFIEKTRQKHLHAQNGRGARPKDAPEVLILNGRSYATSTT